MGQILWRKKISENKKFARAGVCLQKFLPKISRYTVAICNGRIAREMHVHFMRETFLTVF